jgi:predicted ribosomally synthesized six-cysteine peptide SCIFF
VSCLQAAQQPGGDEVAEESESVSKQAESTKDFEIILRPVAAEVPEGADCSACSSSCQSACKTSCTVGNQPCAAAATIPA